MLREQGASLRSSGALRQHGPASRVCQLRHELGQLLHVWTYLCRQARYRLYTCPGLCRRKYRGSADCLQRESNNVLLA
ncbi:unnamed protein product [Timema podura]|uniref:Uncharacterized protein n=1 Tax=Timema podura TaxID=61482 RepID=A0ABN7PNG7_TIMPD|nr:unnamed protein product [Timema podura]